MASYLKSTAYTRMFKLISSTDHISLKIGVSATVNLSKAGAAFGAAGGTVTEVANGWYKIALTTTDTNTAGDLAFYITGTGADDTDFCDQVIDPTVANLGVNVVNWNNTVVATPATAGIPDVNVKNMNNVAATPITTIKAVQGLTTADTIVTYTGNTVQTGDSFARIGAAGAGLTAVVAASVTGAVGSVTGAVGSVTGAVGSVTAQVTANVAQVNGVTVNGNGAGTPWGP